MAAPLRRATTVQLLSCSALLFIGLWLCWDDLDATGATALQTAVTGSLRVSRPRSVVLVTPAPLQQSQLLPSTPAVGHSVVAGAVGQRKVPRSPAALFDLVLQRCRWLAILATALSTIAALVWRALPGSLHPAPLWVCAVEGRKLRDKKNPDAHPHQAGKRTPPMSVLETKVLKWKLKLHRQGKLKEGSLPRDLPPDLLADLEDEEEDDDDDDDDEELSLPTRSRTSKPKAKTDRLLSHRSSSRRRKELSKAEDTLGRSWDDFEEEEEEEEEESLCWDEGSDDSDMFEDGNTHDSQSLQWGSSLRKARLQAQVEELLGRTMLRDQTGKQIRKVSEVGQSFNGSREVKQQGVAIPNAPLTKSAHLHILCGASKGRRLYTPSVHLRPMMSKVRAALFNTLTSVGLFELGGVAAPSRRIKVLDVFAGSGSIGCEALSRGAELAFFVDISPECCAAALKNGTACGSSPGSVVVLQGDALEVLRNPQKFRDGARMQSEAPFDLVTITPPYLEVSYPDLLEAVCESPLVGPETLVVIEYAKSQRSLFTPVVADRLYGIRNRRYGRTHLAMYIFLPKDTEMLRPEEFTD